MKNRASRKIYISGTSGAGKTTLAEYISKRFRIPFISSSAKELWPEYGITTHKELIELTQREPKVGERFQEHLLEYRFEKLEGKDEYVTDRSPLDNLIYYLCQVSSTTTAEATRQYIKLCREAYPEEFTQIYLTCHPFEIEDDGYRVTNPYYQTTLDVTFMHYLQNHWDHTNGNTKLEIITEWDWEVRVRKMEKLFNPKKTIKEEIWQKIRTKLKR